MGRDGLGLRLAKVAYEPGGVRTRPMKNPPHLGDFIRTEIVEPAGLSVTAAASALQVSGSALSSLLNSKDGLSGEIALRMECR
ncbi:MAG: hypothetical protein EBY17_24860 [Acidobacteriia bacterium]|nr:hypothetical protein [Terriglobia bacterium]